MPFADCLVKTRIFLKRLKGQLGRWYGVQTPLAYRCFHNFGFNG